MRAWRKILILFPTLNIIILPTLLLKRISSFFLPGRNWKLGSETILSWSTFRTCQRIKAWHVGQRETRRVRQKENKETNIGSLKSSPFRMSWRKSSRRITVTTLFSCFLDTFHKKLALFTISSLSFKKTRQFIKI